MVFINSHHRSYYDITMMIHFNVIFDATLGKFYCCYSNVWKKPENKTINYSSEIVNPWQTDRKSDFHQKKNFLFIAIKINTHNIDKCCCYSEKKIKSKSRKAVYSTAGNLFLMLFLERGVAFYYISDGWCRCYGVVVEIVTVSCTIFFSFNLEGQKSVHILLFHGVVCFFIWFRNRVNFLPTIYACYVI